MSSLEAFAALASSGLQIGSGISGYLQSGAAADAAGREARNQVDAARLDSLRLMGVRRALYAKAGVDPNSGSPLDVMLDAALVEEAAAIREGFGLRQRAGYYRSAGEGTLIESLGGSAVTLLGHDWRSSSRAPTLAPAGGGAAISADRTRYLYANPSPGRPA